MEVLIGDNSYPVIILKKKNKNTYIRVNAELQIVVTTSFLTSQRHIAQLLEENKVAIQKMIDRQKKEMEKEDSFYYLGQKYDIIIVPTMEDVEMDGHYIYTKSHRDLEKWLQKQMKNIFQEHVEIEYKKFEEKIPFPKLKIRKMKTRWGVCNRRDTSITLNANLIKEKIECLDYVIVHELSHLVHFDHSKNFWLTVSKYCKDYKTIRKNLKE